MLEQGGFERVRLEDSKLEEKTSHGEYFPSLLGRYYFRLRCVNAANSYSGICPASHFAGRGYIEAQLEGGLVEA